MATSPARKSRKSASGGRPRTEPIEVRRQQLILAAIESIGQCGIPGTSVARVTSLANVSLGMVNLHFDTKEDLLAEALRFMVTEHYEIWHRTASRAGLTDPERLLAIVDSHFLPEVCNRKRLSAWFAFFGEAGNRGVYLRIADELDAARKEETIRLCRAIAKQGRYTGVDPELTALTLEGMFDGLWLNMLLYPKEFTPARAKAQIRIYLAGMFPNHFQKPPRQHERGVE